MKSVKLIALVMLGAAAMSFTTIEKTNAAYQLANNASPIKWKAEAVDLGEITFNKPVTIEFEFTNTGDLPAIVINAQASCGCTVANYPKEPIQPGKTATITATYNAATKGVFAKSVTVTIQNEDPKVLTFKGTVI